ncbi:MAG TPA: chain length determinant protein tyrosine kinase EpsG, partial [Usitatibacter sp.]|nr:chain length determinant protein tyrosine kinase EpsG [Usitatibacter sp.]
MSMQDNVLSFDSPRALVRAERTIGAILVDDGKLSESEVERVLERHQAEGIRFGEAAVRLGLVN